MTNAEMLFEMIQLQKAYDQAVYEEFETEYDETKTRLALLDEIGETNHELKSLWCWWKKTQKPVDWDKALEELADCWHFVLSIYYHNIEDWYGRMEWAKISDECIALFKENRMMFNCIWAMDFRPDRMKLLLECMEDITGGYNALRIVNSLINLTLCLGFDFEEIYEAYKEKNKVNYERLKNGYQRSKKKTSFVVY